MPYIWRFTWLARTSSPPRRVSLVKDGARSPIVVAYVSNVIRGTSTSRTSYVMSRRVASCRGDPQVPVAPAARRNCYGNFIDRVRVCAPSLVAQYEDLNVALRPPGRSIATADAAAVKRARKERPLLNSIPSSPVSSATFFFLLPPWKECDTDEKNARGISRDLTILGPNIHTRFVDVEFSWQMLRESFARYKKISKRWKVSEGLLRFSTFRYNSLDEYLECFFTVEIIIIWRMINFVFSICLMFNAEM